MCGKTADIQIPVVKTPNCVWSYEHPTPLGLYPLALLSIKFTSSMTTEPLPHDFFKLPSIPPSNLHTCEDQTIPTRLYILDWFGGGRYESCSCLLAAAHPLVPNCET